MEEKITAEMLEDGSILVALTQQYGEDRSDENFIALLSCLRDSVVWVPMNVIVSQEDQEQFLKAKVGEEVKNKNAIRLKPDILAVASGAQFFPVFSQKEQIDEEYGRHFSMMPMPFLQALAAAQTYDVVGIVVDAFSAKLVIEKELFDFIKEMPTQLEE